MYDSLGVIDEAGHWEIGNTVDSDFFYDGAWNSCGTAATTFKKGALTSKRCLINI